MRLILKIAAFSFCVATSAADITSKLTYNAAAKHRSGYISAFQDTIPHFAAGGDWVTSFTVMNFQSQAASVGVSVTDDNGQPVAIPVTDIGTTSSFTVVVPANGTTVFETDYRPFDPLRWGMV